MTQHLHNKIGNAIGECKRRLFDRLKSGADLDNALAQFFGELTLALDTIAYETNKVSAYGEQRDYMQQVR